MVLKTGGSTEYERILKSYNDSTDDQERAFALRSLGASPDPDLKKRTLDWAVKDVKLQDISAPFTSVASSSFEGSNIAWAYFQEVIGFFLILFLRFITSHSE
jgi:hypothetical protein